ncbi:MAG: HDIG domain-containing protein [Prolixibacteraceae bacterium]|jgi:putative nucleotidyltransferase with HDIG domain|nr:HDIG domain-containing protein [Prolixibacteraceae bacterium]
MGNKENKFLSLYRKFYYAIFLILAFALIYVLYPKQGTFKYEFQKGKPWAHENLLAPFDFPILKPVEEYQAEKDTLLKEYIPYFSVDTSVQAKQLDDLREGIENAFLLYSYHTDSVIQNGIASQLLLLFDSLYQEGIIENEIESYKALDEKQELNLIENNISTKVLPAQIYSLKNAYLQINLNLKVLAQSDTVLLGLQQFIDFSQYLAPNVSYDDEVNAEQIDNLLKTISTTRGVVQSGVRIISQGDLVSNDNYLILESLKQAYNQNRAYGGWISAIIVGQMLLIATLLTMLVLYLQSFNRKLFWKKRNFSLIITTVLTIFVLARLIYDNDFLNLYILPVCILPIIIRTFIGARMAIYIHLITMLLIGFMAPNSFEFLFIQTIAGTVAVISLSKLHRRGHLVITSLLIVLVYFVLFVSFGLIKEGSLEGINWGDLKWFAVNGLLLLLAYPLIYVFEKIFGFISDVTLMELSDTNHPLLRELAELAPGTFQHSMQVANLAEEVVVRTGGNPMLVRTGALYHDVGKIKSSQYFIENQLGGKNPHDKLSKIKSAERIISHVNDGVVLARKHNIPESIIDFIKMHHGRSMAKYFYLKYKEENPDIEITEEQFTYPGPNPTTRETAIVMLADGVEAGTRSLLEKNEESIKSMINHIINSKVQNHELDEAPITFKDIKDIKAIFLEKLKNIYHLRIQYPNEPVAKNEV